jgi:hypothetical protein
MRSTDRGTDRITAAFVANAPNAASAVQIHAGGDVKIQADHDYHVSQLTGTAAVGLVAAGAGISVATINNVTQSYLGTYNTIDAGGDVTIHASDEQKAQPTTIKSLGAAAGLFVVEANVAVVTLNSDTDAYVNSQAEIQGAMPSRSKRSRSPISTPREGLRRRAAAAGGGCRSDGHGQRLGHGRQHGQRGQRCGKSAACRSWRLPITA